MHDFTLVSYKMIRAKYNQFDKHFYLFHCVSLCLKTNWSDLPSLHKSFRNQMCNGMSPFIKKMFHTNMQGESKQLLPLKKSRRGCSFFIWHLPILKRNFNVAWPAAFLDIMNIFGILHQNKWICFINYVMCFMENR